MKSFKSTIKEKIRSEIFNNYHFRNAWKMANPFVGTDKEWEGKGKSDFILGIAYDPAHYHRYFIAACIDLGISYKVVDLLRDDWIDVISKSGIKGLMIWPHINSQVLKEILDERILLLERDMKFPVYPDSTSIGLLDNKRRVRDWLLANNFEPPKTWCFSEKEQAMDFVSNFDFPLVFKTTKGSVSRGVEIVKSKSRAEKLISKCFGKGIHPYRMDSRNKQWDFILFQEYLHNCYEKRMIRVGDSFFSIAKVRGDDPFHSGSGFMEWGEKEDSLLNQTKQITDKGNFRCMNVDFLVDESGKTYVNELHALFHGPRIPESQLKGRYLFSQSGDWDFEPGNFYRNYTTNLRVLDFISSIGLRFEEDQRWKSLPVFYEIDGRRM